MWVGTAAHLHRCSFYKIGLVMKKRNKHKTNGKQKLLISWLRRRNNELTVYANEYLKTLKGVLKRAEQNMDIRTSATVRSKINMIEGTLEELKKDRSEGELTQEPV